MNAIKKLCIFSGVAINIISILVMLCGHTTIYDVGASICVYLTAVATGILVTYGLTR